MKRRPVGEIIALILVCGCMVVIFCGIDGEMKAILAMSAVWAFKSEQAYRQERK